VNKGLQRTALAMIIASALTISAAQVAGASVSTDNASGSTAHRAAVKQHPILLPTAANQWAQSTNGPSPLQPPAPPCPENGQLPSPFSNCGLPGFPAVGQPYLGNMAYWGGHVQVHPHVYLILWGWGQPGAFSGPCRTERFQERTIHVTLKCDPQGVGKRMADFVSEMGGTQWAGVQTQYYQDVKTATGTKRQFIVNDKNVLAGVWTDNTNRITKKVTYTNMAEEAQRAAAHFHVAKKDLINANFVIAQPALFSDPQAAKQGYCAFHDYTQKEIEGGIYKHVTAGLAYTNMPYVASQGTGCGANLVNAGAAGALDGVTIALGHEIEETVTDPGAEDVLSDGTILGGWFDPFDANENGDKCAYVGDDFGLTDPSSTGEPGSAGNITGNRGGKFPVQSLWSNTAAGGAGYCAGAGTDLPF
jgi:hypothetical protein